MTNLLQYINSIHINENTDNSKIIFNLIRIRQINYRSILFLLYDDEILNNFISIIIQKKLICEIIINNLKIDKQSINYKRHIYRYNLLHIFSTKQNIMKLLRRFKEINELWNKLTTIPYPIGQFCLCHFENPIICNYLGLSDKCSALFNIFLLEYIPTVYSNINKPYNSNIP